MGNTYGCIFLVFAFDGGHGPGYHIYILERRTYMDSRPGGGVQGEGVSTSFLENFRFSRVSRCKLVQYLLLLPEFL